MRFALIVLLFGSLIAPAAMSQQTPKLAPKKATRAVKATKLTREQNFILQTVQSAVALSQPDPQDRLRVLNSAAHVTASIAPKYSTQLAKEGVELESFLVANGQTPMVSIMASGRADCATMKAFVEPLNEQAIYVAEQSLIGAISKCPKMTLELVRQKADFALDKGLIAPRLLMALMEKSGAGSAWTQERFPKLFSSLPDATTETSKLAAPDYASMYASLAPKIGKDVARSTGLKLFAWLGKVEVSSERSVAVNITASAMEEALGKEKYQEVLEQDIIVRQLVEAKGPPAELPPVEVESASVLRAMGGKGTEQQADLRELPPSLRAREAAAHGFARGIAQDKDSASSFFDMAFSAADETWSQRARIKNAAGVVEEVSEAAAHVDALDALRRAQGLQDPTAQALGMIAVARVVSGRDTR
ncbi:MAG: hypothetical protein ABIP81_05475 [Terriglobales bacterium]